MGELTLDWLLAPLSVGRFVDEMWGRRVYFLERNDANYFKRLFGAEALETVLEYSNPLPPALRILKGDKKPDASTYIQRNGRLDLNRLRSYFAGGHTIVVNGIHNYWSPIASLVQAIQAGACFEVLVNAYVTPPSSQGLLPHYDTHDVLVLQIAGTKVWRIYGEEVACPLNELTHSDSDSFSRDALPSPEIMTMTPGSVLYIPRGRIHEAESGELSSTHLTIGLFPPTWLDLFNKVVESLSFKHDEMRRSVPFGYLNDLDARSGLGGIFRRVLALVEAHGSVEDGIGALEDDFLRLGRSGTDGQFVASVVRLEALKTNTLLMKRPYVRSRVLMTEEGIALQFARSLVQASFDYRAALLFVSNAQEPFHVADIPGLDEANRVGLARTLVRDGLLAFVEVASQDESLGWRQGT